MTPRKIIVETYREISISPGRKQAKETMACDAQAIAIPTR
jgi:hypothetical protein